MYSDDNSGQIANELIASASLVTQLTGEWIPAITIHGTMQMTIELTSVGTVSSSSSFENIDVPDIEYFVFFS